MQLLIWLGTGLYRYNPRNQTWKHAKGWAVGDETERVAFFEDKVQALNELGKIIVMDGESAIAHVFRELGMPVSNNFGDLTKPQADRLVALARQCGLSYAVCSDQVRPFLKKPYMVYALASHFEPEI